MVKLDVNTLVHFVLIFKYIQHTLFEMYEKVFEEYTMPVTCVIFTDDHLINISGFSGLHLLYSGRHIA